MVPYYIGLSAGKPGCQATNLPGHCSRGPEGAGDWPVG